jgi:hypothetical protein
MKTGRIIISDLYKHIDDLQQEIKDYRDVMSTMESEDYSDTSAVVNNKAYQKLKSCLKSSTAILNKILNIEVHICFEKDEIIENIPGIKISTEAQHK